MMLSWRTLLELHCLPSAKKGSTFYFFRVHTSLYLVIFSYPSIEIMDQGVFVFNRHLDRNSILIWRNVLKFGWNFLQSVGSALDKVVSELIIRMSSTSMCELSYERHSLLKTTFFIFVCRFILWDPCFLLAGFIRSFFQRNESFLRKTCLSYKSLYLAYY